MFEKILSVSTVQLKINKYKVFRNSEIFFGLYTADVIRYALIQIENTEILIA